MIEHDKENKVGLVNARPVKINVFGRKVRISSSQKSKRSFEDHKTGAFSSAKSDFLHQQIHAPNNTAVAPKLAFSSTGPLRSQPIFKVEHFTARDLSVSPDKF